MKSKLWNDRFIIDAYELAREGRSDEDIRKVFGISNPTFWNWKKRRPLLKEALERGRRISGGDRYTGETLRSYVFGRLPDDLKKTWNEINRLDRARSGTEAVEAILAERGKRARQHLLLYAILTSSFSISASLRKVNINRATFDRWIREDREFARLVTEVNEIKADFFESHLVRLVKSGDTAATIFANRTFNRERGYGEKIDVNMSGRVDHRIDISDLDLPIKTRREILAAVRRKRVENREVGSTIDENREVSPAREFGPAVNDNGTEDESP